MSMEAELMEVRNTNLEQRKAQTYLEFIDLFLQTADATKKRKQVKNAGVKILQLGIQLAILSPDSVFTAYKLWLSKSREEESNPTEMSYLFGNLLLEMRKDMVGRDTSCRAEEILDIFVNNEMFDA